MQALGQEQLCFRHLPAKLPLVCASSEGVSPSLKCSCPDLDNSEYQCCLASLLLFVSSSNSVLCFCLVFCFKDYSRPAPDPGFRGYSLFSHYVAFASCVILLKQLLRDWKIGPFPGCMQLFNLLLKFFPSARICNNPVM